MVSIHPPSTHSAEYVEVASVIEFEASSGETAPTIEGVLLPGGAQMVKEHETATPLWYGLKQVPLEVVGQTADSVLGGGAGKYCIIDFFTSMGGLEKHMEGEVPKAIKENEGLVAGGYEFVQSAIKNFNVIGVPHVGSNVEDAMYMSYISMRAGDGQAENLKNLLLSGLEAVKENELKTSFWTAVQRLDDENDFGIIDMFDSMEGVDEHFASPAVVPTAVQQALGANPDLIVGGFADGVVPNIRLFQFVSRKDAFSEVPVTDDDISAWKTAREEAEQKKVEEAAAAAAAAAAADAAAAAAEAEAEAAAKAEADAAAAQAAAEKEEKEKNERRKHFLLEAAKKSKNLDKNASATMIQKVTRGYLTRVRVYRTVLENERARWETSIEQQIITERRRAAALERERRHVESYWINYLSETDQLKRLKEAEIKRTVQNVNQKTRIQTRELSRKENCQREEMLLQEATSRMELVYEFDYFGKDIRALEEKRVMAGLTVQGTRHAYNGRELDVPDAGDEEGFTIAGNPTYGRKKLYTVKKSAYDHIDLPAEPSRFAERSRQIQAQVKEKRMTGGTSGRHVPSMVNKYNALDATAEGSGAFGAASRTVKVQASSPSASTNKMNVTDKSQMFALSRSRYGNGSIE